MAASENLSSARVAPRSVMRDAATSTMISSRVAAVESGAFVIDDIIAEVAVSRITERGATRADDKFSEGAMEDRKREGYF